MDLSFSYRPCFPLNQFVEIIWVGKNDQISLEHSHHPAIFTELIFNYGDTFEVIGQNIQNFHGSIHHRILSGLKTESFQTKVLGRYNNIGLILKPFCYGLLIHQFDSKAMEQVSEILYEQIFERKNPNYGLIEQKLLKLFLQKRLDSDLLKFEKYVVSHELGNGLLSNFNRSISISQKSFIQKFKKNYLITPGEYVQLKQVNHAVAILQSNRNVKLVHVGADSGFYDQSHFIRVFKKYCGESPKQFARSIKGIG